MPEGPEIRRAADQLSRAVQGRPLEHIYLPYPSLRSYGKKIKGATVRAFTPHGKALLTHFDTGLSLYSHNQLYGVWETARLGDPYLKGRQLRLELGAGRKTVRLYSATDIKFWKTTSLQDHPFLVKLGPDILDPALSVASISERSLDPRFSQQTLGSLLLNQAFLAGLGNYLRTEILFAANLDPDWRPFQLSRQQRLKLANAALTLSRQSYQTGGITLDLKRATRLKASGATFEDHRFWIFDRSGLPCYRCTTPIATRTVLGRRLYYCASCQSKPQI